MLILVLIFGGAYSGKLHWVKDNFNIKEAEIYYCGSSNNSKEIDFSKKVINNFHKFTYEITLDDKDPLEYIIDNEKLFDNKIIICDDISEGIVPLKKEERLWRENTGKCLQYLSKKSNKVYRIFCGIPMVIKDE
ncbi:bifunctional adenosylcobinamide kinase/adenosylcobinamide-phosphate guanylyltransferase [Clostridium sp. MB05]|uniref:bifunctional adenosylcobinamide kinase/adenosylcobinamide-phosphate guanylyltransferase n=1 Tax=Clostridium sp. MB05 TaxID=3376682 RepID=UPI0039821CA5